MCATDEIQYDFCNFKLKFQGLEYNCRSSLHTGLGHFFGSHRSFVDFPIEKRLITLRNLVYDQIHGELKTVLESLLRLCDQADSA